MDKFKLAIDLGSTEFKAAIFTAHMRLAGYAGRKLSYRRTGVRVELPGETALEAFREVVARAILDAGIKAGQVGSIGVTSQAQTFAAMNQADEFISPFISWLDMRATETCKKLAARPELKDFASHSGTAEIMPNMRICLLKHFLDENLNADAGNLKVMPLPSYLSMLLTGEYVIDDNLAAMSGLFSIKDNKYWQPALDLLGINERNLPKVIKIGQVAGCTTTDNPFGFQAGMPLFACGNDQTAGAFGAGLRPGDMLITLGTAQIVYQRRRTMPAAGKVQFRGSYPGAGFYAMFAAPGGDIITQAIAKEPGFKDFDTFAELATRADAGLPEKAAAVLDALADGIFDFYTRLSHGQEETGNLYIAGGGIKISAWREAIKQKIKRDIKSIEVVPVNGAALMMKTKEGMI